jgi:hypothetical protein
MNKIAVFLIGLSTCGEYKSQSGDHTPGKSPPCNCPDTHFLLGRGPQTAVVQSANFRVTRDGRIDISDHLIDFRFQLDDKDVEITFKAVQKIDAR